MEKSLKNQKPMGKNKPFGVRDTYLPGVKSPPTHDVSVTQHHNRRREALIEAEYKRSQAVTTFRRYIVR